MLNILMPALSPTMEQGTLARWHVAVGDRVRAGDVVAEIETDKATMEVEAAEDGVVAALLVPAGSEEVKVNTPIAHLNAPSATNEPSPAPAKAAAEPALSPAVRRIVAEERLEASSLVGSGRDGRLTKGDVLEAVKRKPADEPTAPRPAPALAPASSPSSPLAARIAQGAGLDLATIRGSGPLGRILKIDVDSARGVKVERAKAVVPESPSHDVRSPSLAEMGVAPGSYDLSPLDGMRRTIARRMTESFRDVPHFPLTIDLEIDALLATRARINAALATDGLKVSVNDLIIQATARALRQVPEANASYTPEGVALHHHADIAVAVAIDGGLITPIIRAAETKGLAVIAAEMRDLAERARTKRLKPEEFQGGTFSISNMGMFGIRTFSSILNAPHGAILSVGAGAPRPVVKDGELAVANVMSVTLTCDHRAMDGVVGARFLQAFQSLIQEPMLLLA